MAEAERSAGQRRRRAGLQLLFLVSGAPGLAAQLAWSRVFGAGLGHELPSLLGVVTAFFLGLAAGAWALDARVARSAHPVRWYAGLEWFSAAWIALTAPSLGKVNHLALVLVGYPSSAPWQAAVALALPFLIVGPAAMAMGGTLAAMERAVAPLLPDRRAVAGLYALNTAGAVAGVGLSVGWLMPEFGFRATLWVAAAVQALCGSGAWWLARGVDPGRYGAGAVGARGAVGENVGRGGAARETAGGRAPRGLLLTALTAGLLGMGYELLGLRVLAQTTENTVQTYAAILGVFLAGTALGAAVLRGAMRRGWEPAAAWLPGLLGVLVLAELWVMAASPTLLASWQSMGGRWRAEVGLAAAVFGFPALVMGAFFSQVTQAARRAAGGVGWALAANTLGGALAAPVLLGLALPAVGLKGALAVVAVGYLILAQPWRPGAARGLVLLAAGLAPFLPARLQFLELPNGAEVRRFDEGLLATVSVVRTGDGHRVLRVNNHFQQGGTATAGAARRHAHLPLLLHPAPRRALFLGLGTGITLGAAASHPGLTADGVELLAGVVAALPEFEPENRAPLRNPALHVHLADARRFVRIMTNRYDVIVADLFHPAEDGAGFLYTRDHFAALRERLAPGGIVCQWLPLHQLDLATFRTVTRTFLEVFPDASLWLLRFNVDVPVVGLVGGAGPLVLDPVALEHRMTSPELVAELKPVALTDAVRLLGCRLAGSESLRRMAGSGPVASDDRPLILFEAGAAAYRPDLTPPAKLVALLGEVDPDFAHWPGPATAEAAGSLRLRLEAFRIARDRHLRGLAREAEGLRREAVEDYVASAAASPDYTAGYAQAILVASAFAQEDPALARGLLGRLIQARPEQRLARDVLERLGK